MKMDKLYIYGCSHSAGNLLGYSHFEDPGLPRIKNDINFMETDYTKWLGRKGMPFFEIIANELNLDWILRAEGGDSNSQQFKKLLKDLPNIKENDVVLFQLTHYHRFEVPYKNDEGKWETTAFQAGGSLKYDNDKYRQFYMAHLDFEDWISINSVVIILSLLNYIKSNVTKNVFLWSYPNIEQCIKENTSILNFPNLIKFECDRGTVETAYECSNHIDWNTELIIEFETNKIVKDSHFGETGHKFIAKNILNYINHNTYIKEKGD